MTADAGNYSNEEKWDFVVPPRQKTKPLTRERSLNSGDWRVFAIRHDISIDKSKTGINYGVENGTGAVMGNYRFKTSGTQITTSEGHPFRNNPDKGKSDIGGDFFTQKRYIEGVASQTIRTTIIDNTNGYRRETKYTGPMLAIDPAAQDYPANPASSNNGLDVLGTQAISRVKPTNPVGGLLTALVELRRDGLPHLFGSSLWEGKTSILRSAGDEYLNKEFGWDPLANDVSDFLGTVTNANSVIDRYKRGVGKPTRRRYDFPSTDTESQTFIGSGYSPFMGGYATGYPRNYAGVGYINDAANGSSALGSLFRIDKTIQKRWFTGAFTYFFPAKYRGRLGNFALLAHELGLELTPENLWNAAPWSWAVDWFTDVGDVLSNYSAFHNDGLVMTYGYIMEHTIVSRTYKLVGCHLSDGKPAPVSDVSFIIETKQRRGATPYGFGLTIGSLSGFQKSIIGALGLTKLFR